MGGLSLALLLACRRPALHVDPRVTPSDARVEASSEAASPPSADASVSPEAALEGDARAALPPLAGEWLQRWTMPSGATVYVTPPQGATEPRPVVVAIHGAEDRADWACGEWRSTFSGFAWVLCPQGVPLRTAFAWNSETAIAKQAFEAVEALRARHGAYVAEGPLLYGGFGQGATLARFVVAAHPGVFDPVVLVEAGHTPISAPVVIYGLKQGKVPHAVLSCSTDGCATFLRDLVVAAKEAGYDLRTNDAGRRGHVFDGEVMRTLGGTLARLFASDPRYARWIR